MSKADTQVKCHHIGNFVMKGTFLFLIASLLFLPACDQQWRAKKIKRQNMAKKLKNAEALKGLTADKQRLMWSQGSRGQELHVVFDVINASDRGVYFILGNVALYAMGSNRSEVLMGAKRKILDWQCPANRIYETRSTWQRLSYLFSDVPEDDEYTENMLGPYEKVTVREIFSGGNDGFDMKFAIGKVVLLSNRKKLRVKDVRLLAGRSGWGREYFMYATIANTTSDTIQGTDMEFQILNAQRRAVLKKRSPLRSLCYNRHKFQKQPEGGGCMGFRGDSTRYSGYIGAGESRKTSVVFYPEDVVDGDIAKRFNDVNEKREFVLGDVQSAVISISDAQFF